MSFDVVTQNNIGSAVILPLPVFAFELTFIPIRIIRPRGGLIWLRPLLLRMSDRSGRAAVHGIPLRLFSRQM